MEGINDLQKILTFASNLNIDTKGYLGLQNPQTLSEAQQLAIAYETHIKNKVFTFDPTDQKSNETTYHKAQKPKETHVIAIQQTNTVTTNEATTEIQLITGDALINKIEFQVIFDCAASQSIIPYTYVQKYDLPYKGSNQTCNLVNGSK